MKGREKREGEGKRNKGCCTRESRRQDAGEGNSLSTELTV